MVKFNFLNENDPLLSAFNYTVLSELGYYTGNKMFKITDYNITPSGDYYIYEVHYSGAYPFNFTSQFVLDFETHIVTNDDIITIDLYNNTLQYRKAELYKMPKYFIERTKYDKETEYTTGIAQLRTLQFPALSDTALRYLYSVYKMPIEIITPISFDLFRTTFLQKKTTFATNDNTVKNYYVMLSDFLQITEPLFLYKRGLVYFTDQLLSLSIENNIYKMLDQKYGSYLNDETDDLLKGYLCAENIGNINYFANITYNDNNVPPNDKSFIMFLSIMSTYIKKVIYSFNEVFDKKQSISPYAWWYYNINKLTIKHNNLFVNQNIPCYGLIYFVYYIPTNKYMPPTILNLNLNNNTLTVDFLFFNTSTLPPPTIVFLYKWDNNNEQQIGVTEALNIGNNVYRAIFNDVSLLPTDYVNIRFEEGNNQFSKGLFRRINDLSILYL